MAQCFGKKSSALQQCEGVTDNIISESSVEEISESVHGADEFDSEYTTKQYEHAADSGCSFTNSASGNTRNICLSSCSEILESCLREWIENEKQVPHESVNRLLSRLSSNFNVPKSVKTLLKSSVSYSFEEMYEGEYVHFNDWKDNFQNFLEEQKFVGAKVSLAVNIDGLNLYNSLSVSKYECYPIIFKALETQSKIFCVGMYVSNNHKAKEMPPCDILLRKFLSEISLLANNPIRVNGKVVQCTLECFICDAPVRAALKNIISHNGYHGCERCDQHGEYHGGTVVFLDTDASLRNNTSFAERADKDHHKSMQNNILEDFSFPMVSGFILDIMHLAFLGVTKRILQRLLGSKAKDRQAIKLSSQNKEAFNECLVSCQNYIPSEFSRKVEGGTSTILNWKASQYRLFLLYLGFVLFKNHMLFTKQFYKNYLKLAIAIRLLSLPDQDNNIPFIRCLLREFVEESQAIYGSSFVTYNVHNLIHLTDDYVKFGPLIQVSAFQYESYLGSQIKGSVRAGFKPLKQIAPHIDRLNSKSSKLNLPDCNIKKSSQCEHSNFRGTCLKKVEFMSTVFRPDNGTSRDSFVRLKDGGIGKIAAIHQVDSQINLHVKLFRYVEKLFNDPVASTDIGVFKVHAYGSSQYVPMSDVSSKLVVLPYKKDKLVAISLIHC